MALGGTSNPFRNIDLSTLSGRGGSSNPFLNIDLSGLVSGPTGDGGGAPVLPDVSPGPGGPAPAQDAGVRGWEALHGSGMGYGVAPDIADTRASQQQSQRMSGGLADLFRTPPTNIASLQAGLNGLVSGGAGGAGVTPPPAAAPPSDTPPPAAPPPGAPPAAAPPATTGGLDANGVVPGAWAKFKADNGGPGSPQWQRFKERHGGSGSAQMQQLKSYFQ
jgi:hypothetical protein